VTKPSVLTFSTVMRLPAASGKRPRGSECYNTKSRFTVRDSDFSFVHPCLTLQKGIIYLSFTNVNDDQSRS
jgi:hypothetical protein